MAEPNFERAIESALQDESRRKQRLYNQGMPSRERLARARQTQSAAGWNIRVARRVLNMADFKPQQKVWLPTDQTGKTVAKKFGTWAVTILDTKQQPLQFLEDPTEEELTEKLRRGHPALFEKTPPLAVTCTDKFAKGLPWIGLMWAYGQVHVDQQEVRRIIAPELALDDSYQQEHRLHVSLGQVFVGGEALVEDIQTQLKPVIPGYVQFGPGEVSVTRADQ